MITLFKTKKDFFVAVLKKKTNFRIIFLKMFRIFKKTVYNKYYTKFTIDNCEKNFFNFCKFSKSGKKNIFVASEYIFSKKKINIYQDFFFFKKKKKIIFLCKGKKNIISLLKYILKIKSKKKRNFFYLLKSNKNKDKYVNEYRRISNLIKKGVVMQTQLCKENLIKTNSNTFNLFNIFKKKNKNQIYLETIRYSIICFSPEILAKIYKKNRRIHMFPIAGTLERGVNIIEDKILEKKLLNNKKEVSEHSMLIDLSRNDLNIFSLINSVKVNKIFKIKKYKNVQHIVSNIMSRFSKNTSIDFILKSISPSGTLSGSPKRKSIELIKNYNLCVKKQRVYGNIFFGGSIGFLKIKKYLAYLMIIIRTMFFRKGYALLKSSSGITLNSKIFREYIELNRKILLFLKKK
ncbi:Anthranilate synthase [Candidatus Vidania fulgoroideae]|nr:Anthranilate synthase [Candidatus Vidania fulgoroideae]